MIIILIKFLAIFLVITGCIIATYTDIKWQIIPNELTFSMILIGLLLVTIYYYLIDSFNLFYYFSVVIIFILSYILWYIGVWAGGDVKLFTAISTLLIPEFLDIVPINTIFNVEIPYLLSSIYFPTLFVMFNSTLSIIPIIMLMVLSIIITKKHLGV